MANGGHTRELEQMPAKRLDARHPGGQGGAGEGGRERATRHSSGGTRNYPPNPRWCPLAPLFLLSDSSLRYRSVSVPFGTSQRLRLSLLGL